MASATKLTATPDGLTQLRRHWAAPDPRARMVLVHGIGEHSGRYEHVGEAFAARGIDVLGFDNRGFGQSGGRRAHVDSFGDFLADLEAVLADQRGDVPLVLMGHSLGGLIATAYLTSDRPQPDLAVLSAPALLAEVPRWQRTLAPVLGRVAATVHVPSAIDAELLSRDPEVQQGYLDDPLVSSGATAGLGNAIFAAMERTMGAIDRLRVPTYVLHGADDRLVPPRASEPLGRLPGVERKVWPNLRHECLNEPERDQVIAGILDWLGRQLDSR